jgi:hypothetical protein
VAYNYVAEITLPLSQRFLSGGGGEKMATEIITIQVDAEAAEAYRAASPEAQKKMQVLLGLWLKEVTAGNSESLKQLMTNIGNKAQARGLTSEELESIFDVE